MGITEKIKKIFLFTFLYIYELFTYRHPFARGTKVQISNFELEPF